MAPHASTDIDDNAAWEHFVAEFQRIQSRYEPPLDRFEAVGKAKMKAVVMPMIARRERITIVLPGFPVKSPNNIDKVLGRLPDRAEELGLERLETFCRAVEAKYPPGCRVVLFSDGRVFADLIGVPPENLKAYKAELMTMVRDAGYTHIESDGLDNHAETDDPINEIMKRFGVDKMDMDARIAAEPPLCNTFKTFCRLLPRDMAPLVKGMSEDDVAKRVSDVAKKMMHRNVAFSTLVEVTYPDALRVSIHLYDNAGPKFGIHLIPGVTGMPKTPWHSVICEDADGSIHRMELKDVDHARYELYNKRGRPWGFKEREQASSVALSATASRVFDVIEQPNHCVVRALDDRNPPSLTSIDRDELVALVHKYGVVRFHGFEEGTDMATIASHVGLQVHKDSITADHPVSTMHFDGVEARDDAPARGQLKAFFSADSAASSTSLFTDTRAIVSLMATELVAKLETTTLRHSIGGNSFTSPVIARGTAPQKQFLRYMEPSPAVEVTVVAGDSDDLEKVLRPSLYSEEFCYEHTWSNGEYVLIDSEAVLCARLPSASSVTSALLA